MPGAVPRAINNRVKPALISVLVSLLVTPLFAQTPSAASPTVYVLTVREDITHNTLFLARRGTREAIEQNAAAFVVDMDTNGGRVDSTEEIMRLLQKLPMPSYTFIDQKAYSAGAFLAAATKAIYMSPGSVIGAATPILLAPGSGAQELPKSYEEKINSALRALIRSTAQENGHNPDVFEAMVDADKEVIMGEEVISPKGKLLTLTSDEARQMHGDPPQPLLSAGTVGSLAEVLEQVGLANATVVRIEPAGFEILARWLTKISPILIMVGVLAIYIEMNTPGIGVPALVAVVVFAIYFLSYFIAGFAGWEQVVLFAIGLTLLGIEIFVLPGFGMAGVLGIIAILAALLWAMLPLTPSWAPTLPTWQQLRLPFQKLALGLGGAVVGMVVLARYLPDSFLFRKLVLANATRATDGYISSREEAKDLVGTSGMAETVLRPAGKGRFDGRLVDVVTDGDMLDRGTPIRIVEVKGSRVLVRRDASGSNT